MGELTPSGSKTFAFSSVPPDSNLPKAPAMTGPDMANEILKLRSELEMHCLERTCTKGIGSNLNSMPMKKHRNLND